MHQHSLKIEQEIYRVLLRYSDGTFPISPLQIAKRMGLRVVEKRHAAKLMEIVAPDGSLDGLDAFSLRWQDQYVIVIDTAGGDSFWRRLRLAHEIGHYVLDGGHAVDGGTASDRLFHGVYARSLLELSCDIFAMGLLMPQMLLKMGGLTTERQITMSCRVSGGMAHLCAASIPFRVRSYTEDDLKLYSKFHLSLRQQSERMRPFRRLMVPAHMSDISEELCY